MHDSQEARHESVGEVRGPSAEGAARLAQPDRGSLPVVAGHRGLHQPDLAGEAIVQRPRVQEVLHRGRPAVQVVAVERGCVGRPGRAEKSAGTSIYTRSSVQYADLLDDQRG